MSVSVSGSSITFSDSSVQNTAPSGFGFKSRIINGAMMIDQRNAGAAINMGSGVFSVDRYVADVNGGAVVSAQRSTVAPTGFTNSLGLTVTTADTSIAAGDYCYLMQSIEGYNVADFGLGTANAATFTLSFWVRSSITGTYSGSFVNSAQNRARTFEYTINSANTWEQKSVTISGDTAGTWLTDNGAGLRVKFALMVGSTYQQATGSWGSTAYATGTSNQVNWVGTNGANFYITGVQLEKGNTATSFDYRPYGTELALCQRYFQSNYVYAGGVWSSATTIYCGYSFPVKMRVAPSTIARVSGGYADTGAGAATVSALAGSQFGSVDGVSMWYTTSSGAGTAGRGGYVLNALTTFSSEL